MRIEIEAPESVKASQPCRARVLLVNDGYQPVPVSRNALLGPSVAGWPEAVEPTFGAADEPLTLHPFAFYGRERSYDALPPGEVEITASYRPPAGGDSLTASRRVRVEPG